MINEKDFEDIICKYPELIEDGLTCKGRQITLYGRRMDILFEDKFKRKLIIELKVGPIKDEHIGQILSYEGMLLSAENPTIRVMLVGNRVPPNIQRSLDHHGIAWKEITLSDIKVLLERKNDKEFFKLFKNGQETPRFQEKMNVFSAGVKIRKESSGVWIFQTNPKYFKMIEKLKHGSDMDTWRIMRFRREIKKGDTVLVWIAGHDAGIYALGEVTSHPVEMLADRETLLYSTEEYKQSYPISQKPCTRAWVQYKKKFIEKPILKEHLKDNSVLKNLPIIRQPQGTNFRVTKEEWEELKKFLSAY